MTISTEIANFGSAVFSGIFLFSAYYAVYMVRNVIKHPLWVVNLEDVIYWCATGYYLFVQIYHTNDGVIRGYYVLGIVLGVLFSWKSFRIFREMWKKFVHKKKQKKID